MRTRLCWHCNLPEVTEKGDQPCGARICTSWLMIPNLVPSLTLIASSDTPNTGQGRADPMRGPAIRWSTQIPDSVNRQFTFLCSPLTLTMGTMSSVLLFACENFLKRKYVKASSIHLEPELLCFKGPAGQGLAALSAQFPSTARASCSHQEANSPEVPLVIITRQWNHPWDSGSRGDLAHSHTHKQDVLKL